MVNHQKLPTHQRYQKSGIQKKQFPNYLPANTRSGQNTSINTSVPDGGNHRQTSIYQTTNSLQSWSLFVKIPRKVHRSRSAMKSQAVVWSVQARQDETHQRITEILRDAQTRSPAEKIAIPTELLGDLFRHLHQRYHYGRRETLAQFNLPGVSRRKGGVPARDND